MSLIQALMMVALSSTTSPPPSAPLLHRNEKPTVRSLVSDCRKYYSFVTARPTSGTVRDAIDVGSCVGYLGGYVEMGEVQMIYASSRPYCYPDGTNYDQVAKLFIDWADKHPESLDEPRFIGLTLAMRDAFPCKAKSP